MFPWIYLPLIISLDLIYAGTCRSLFLAFETILPQRSYATYNNDTCWDQCYVARADFALILNNRNHTQYEWCSPGDVGGLCIIDQGILVLQETCRCTIIVRFPRILKDSEKDQSGNSCAVKDIQNRLSLSKRGKYTDFPVDWHPVMIQMKREGGLTKLPAWVDHYESRDDVECKQNKDDHYGGEWCGWKGECIKQKFRGRKHRCEHGRDPELNLIDTVPEELYYRTAKSMDFLQLDNNHDYLPVIPYL